MEELIPREAKIITLAVLSQPEIHFRACREDISGRPQELQCVCPLAYAIDIVHSLKVKESI